LRNSIKLLRDVNKIGKEKIDILKETKVELRYVYKELEAAKLLATQTLDDYDDMKLNKQFYQTKF
jgi:hypothetical protein